MLLKPAYLYRAIQYTIKDQGSDMAVYCDPSHYQSPEYIEWGS